MRPTKRDKKTWLLPNHKLYSFNCFVLNDNFSNIFVHQTKTTEKILQLNIFCLFHFKQKIILIFFPQLKHYFITL
jgi:hypothetical protein